MGTICRGGGTAEPLGARVTAASDAAGKGADRSFGPRGRAARRREGTGAANSELVKAAGGTVCRGGEDGCGKREEATRSASAEGAWGCWYGAGAVDSAGSDAMLGEEDAGCVGGGGGGGGGGGSGTEGESEAHGDNVDAAQLLLPPDVPPRAAATEVNEQRGARGTKAGRTTALLTAAGTGSAAGAERGSGGGGHGAAPRRGTSAAGGGGGSNPGAAPSCG